MKKSDNEEISSNDLKATILESMEKVCNFCNAIAFEPCTLDCGHIFCFNELNEWKKFSQDCPECSKELPENLKPQKFIPPIQNTKLPEIDFSELKLEKKKRLGKGSQGSVYPGTYKNLIIAAKVYDVEEDSKKESLKLLGALKHPNIIQFFGISANEDDEPILVMELIEPGNLRKVLDSLPPAIAPNGGRFGWSKFFSTIKNLTRGVLYLHRKGFVHRDLKTTNILIGFDDSVKISDFDLAKNLSNGSKSSIVKGTYNYMAPERMIKGSSITKSSDIYSIGVLIWELLTSEIPFKGLDPVQILEAVFHKSERPIFTPNFSPLLKNLIEKCWNQNPKLRPSGEELLIALYKIEKTFIQKSNSNSNKFSATFIELPRGNTEEMELRNLIHKTMSSRHLAEGKRLYVDKIIKVENPVLAALFEERKKKLGPKCKVEQLFHGTQKEVAEEIAKNGFSLPESIRKPEEGQKGECGSEVLMFGQGIYFSEVSTKGASFSEDTLIIAEVASANVLELNTADNELTPEKMEEKGYDTVYSLPDSKETGGTVHSETVIYNPNQALVKYIVTFSFHANKTVETYLEEIKQWESKAPKPNHFFKDVDLNEIEAKLNETETIERALTQLADLCRDDKENRNNLLNQQGIWETLTRIFSVTNESTLWKGLRFINNFSFSYPEGQKTLQKYSMVSFVLPLLDSENEIIIQKASISICNLTAHYPELIKDTISIECTKQLVKIFSKVSEPLTKILIVRALANYFTCSQNTYAVKKEIEALVLETIEIFKEYANLYFPWFKTFCQFWDNYTLTEKKSLPILAEIICEIFTFEKEPFKTRVVQRLFYIYAFYSDYETLDKLGSQALSAFISIIQNNESNWSTLSALNSLMRIPINRERFKKLGGHLLVNEKLTSFWTPNKLKYSLALVLNNFEEATLQGINQTRNKLEELSKKYKPEIGTYEGYNDYIDDK